MNDIEHPSCLSSPSNALLKLAEFFGFVEVREVILNEWQEENIAEIKGIKNSSA